ncbi:ATP-binding protein, partial [Methylobacterium hispanicum]
ETAPATPALDPAENRAGCEAVLQGLVADADAARQPVAVVYQDFLVRCRMRGLDGDGYGMPAFRRALSVARAGVEAPSEAGEGGDDRWSAATNLAATMPEEVQGVFLLIARAALAGASCPGDAALAKAIGSRSPGRARRLLGYMESRGAVVSRTDFRGNRVIAVPGLSCETAPGDPKAEAAPADAPAEGTDWQLFAAE